MGVCFKREVFKFLNPPFNKLLYLTFLAYLFLLLVTVHLPAQTSDSELFLQQEPKFRHFTVADGLPENTVKWIIQDHLGFLWLSTQNGLVKYDGYSFTTYTYQPGDPGFPINNERTSLSDRNLMEILEDHLGTIWVGTMSGGLNKFNRDTETFTHYRHQPGDSTSLSHDGAYTLYEDKNGILWIGTGGGLNKFDRETETFYSYHHDPQDPTTLSNDVVYSMLEDRFGNFWVGTRNGLNRFDRQIGKVRRYLQDPQAPHSLSQNTIATIYEDISGGLWIGTARGGLNRFDYKTETFFHYQFERDEPYSISHNHVMSVLEDHRGNFWVGTYGGGLNLFDRQTGRFYRYQNSPNNPNSISGNFIRFIFEDRSGVLWIGTWMNGLNKLDAYSNKFTHYQHNSQDNNSLNNSRVWALEADRDGNLWIGTEGGGLNRLNRNTGLFSAYVHDPDNSHSLSNNWVGIVYEDPSGILWVGTYGGGLNRFDRQNERFTCYMHNQDDPNSLSGNNIQAIFRDSQGYLWVGTRDRGLNKLDPETGIFIHCLPDQSIPGHISNRTINSVFEDSYGTLWIGTDGRGLNKYNRDSDSFTQYYDPEKGFDIILNIYEDSQGRLWVGTYRGGLHLFDRSAGTTVVFTEKEGLAHNSIKGIVEDETGNLWLGTERGLSKFNYKDRTFRNYDVEDGLQGNHFNYHAACKTADGTLFFGGLNGFNSFHPDRLEHNRFPPQVALTNFKIFNQSVFVGKDSPLERHINVAEEIILPYWQNDISLGYAGLHFSCPEKNSFAFKLDNYENEWRQVGHQRSAMYTNLDPGQYVFRVKAANRDGVWNPEGASIRIIVQPPIWGTWWFRTLAVVVVLLVAFAVYKRRIQQIEAKKTALEIRVKERTEAAKALQNALNEVEQLKNRLQAENVYLQDEIKLVHNFESIITCSRNFKKLLRSVEQVASTDATVLILGESGTGKELLARAIHNISPRGERPLVKVNCAALPSNLIESELFGHEKGAFTGALSRKVGRFELADGGTVFLDEIGDLPLELQTKLLRVLQEGEFERLGNSKTTKVDVRILAATNRNLEGEVENGNFREDLFYRLNVFPVKIPPLRERKEDVSLLVKHFIQKYARKIGREVNAVPRHVLETLQQYHWPGNVRELENVIERAIIISQGNKLLLGDWMPQNHNPSNGQAHFHTLEECEKHHIVEALEKTGWRVSGDKGAARILGLHPKTLESRMRRLNIKRKNWRY